MSANIRDGTCPFKPMVVGSIPTRPTRDAFSFTRSILVVSLFRVDSLWGDDGQQQLFNRPLVIGQSGCQRGCLGVPPPLPFMHPDRERLAWTCAMVDPVFPGTRR